MTASAGETLRNRRNQRVVVFDSAEALAGAAATAFVEASRRAVDDRSRFLVALAGGSTPQALYRCLAQDEALRAAVPWHLVHVFWGDERCVAPDHVDSNYRMACETLLSHVPIPTGQVHRMPADDPEPDRGARAYELALQRVG
ncbi:MAG: hypothetical protein FJX72_06075, partial [Armatimonadetes bacterium]|nr:hypothetical protein [Armatimonadota bacterium]